MASQFTDSIELPFDPQAIFPPGSVVQKYIGDMFTIVEADEEVLRARQVFRSPKK